MDRRHFLQFAGAAALSSQIPFSFANSDTALTVYGPPALPTLLTAVASQHQAQGQSAIQQAFNVQTWRSPDMLRAGLANGSIQASIVPSYVAANLYNRGMKVKLVNILTWGLLDLVGPSGQISTLKDLEGRKVAIPMRNDMPDLVFQALCKAQGADISKIDINYTGTPAESMLYWLGGKVEFAVLMEPLSSVALTRAGDKSVSRVINFTELWRELNQGKSHGLPQAGLLVTQEFYDKHTQFVVQVQEELQHSLAWTLENPDTASEIGSKILDLPAMPIKKAIPNANLTAIAASEIKEDLKLFFQTLYELNPKILGGSLPKDDFILSL
ncbi:hypothetical protein AAEX37_00686 [Oligella sp. MSHR50489EDL]|uniref:ABC transporter substrate-binding protein n=1 Tax=Oligella sp. MSHR50489EDL TaxID=3139409 RepID=UPI003D816D30